MKKPYQQVGNWDVNVTVSEDGNSANTDVLSLAVLCVIRDELKKLNRVLNCQNFLRIPQKLDAIRKNTAKPKRKTKPTAKKNNDEINI